MTYLESMVPATIQDSKQPLTSWQRSITQTCQAGISRDLEKYEKPSTTSKTKSYEKTTIKESSVEWLKKRKKKKDQDCTLSTSKPKLRLFWPGQPSILLLTFHSPIVALIAWQRVTN